MPESKHLLGQVANEAAGVAVRVVGDVRVARDKAFGFVGAACIAKACNHRREPCLRITKGKRPTFPIIMQWFLIHI